ncbi:P-loop containing nucleoside triphosphate hydrolase protein [Xylariaceae sp. FL0662B]|nr:P-loop containing nucleoside triphosphate hydrolase protein [Xylariaceae sp. FL0662B]
MANIRFPTGLDGSNLHNPSRMVSPLSSGNSYNHSIHPPSPFTLDSAVVAPVHAYSRPEQRLDTSRKLSNGTPQINSKRTSSWRCHVNAVDWKGPRAVPLKQTSCPETTAGVLSRLTFSWITPLITVGNRRRLENDDIWLVNPKRSVNILTEIFYAVLQGRIDREHILLLALYDTFKHDFWVSGLWRLVVSLSQVAIPVSLRFILSFVTEAYAAAKIRSAVGDEQTDVQGPSPWKGVGLVAMLIMLQLILSLSTTHFTYRSAVLGAQARGMLVAAIFEKSTIISGDAQAAVSTAQGEERHNSTQNPRNSGNDISKMSSDTALVDQAARALHLTWTTPITLVLVFGILAVYLASSAVVGICLLLVGIPGLTIAVKSSIRRQSEIRQTSNARISLTQEILRSSRFVKFNAWERPFLAKLRDLRKKEIGLLTKLLLTKDVVHVISFSLPVFAAMLSFIVFSKTGHRLTAANVFSSLTLFSTLRVPFNAWSVAAGQVAEGWAALKRLEAFFLAEEHDEDVIWDQQSHLAISLERASFSWGQAGNPRDAANSMQLGIYPRTTSFSLVDIDFSVYHGELLAVVGPVGSGKSSLLCALAGQMRKAKGDFVIGAEVMSRALCPQNAWIQHASLKDNILFGRPMNRELYDRTIEACSLKADIQALPAGDETEIGERGINLSGGQRQRINLARAIYADTDIVLMDDPLSAVDAHVGRHIFEHAICGMMKRKTRILVTHHLHVLSRCSRVLWIDNGHVKALGTYDNLVRAEPGFRAMISVAMGAENEAILYPEINRHAATADRTQPTREKQAIGDGVLVKEESQGARAPLHVIKSYARSSGHLLNAAIPIVILVLAQGSTTMTNVWLSFWTSNRFGTLSQNGYISIYVALAVAQATLAFLFAATVSVLGSRASRRMLDRAIAKIVGAPLSFHDSQPLGRIMNLFTHDAEAMDQRLPDSLGKFLSSIALVFSTCALVVAYFSWFALVLAILLVAYLYATAYYRAAARQLKRIEAVLRGVVFAQFVEALSGIPIIRAYGGEARFARRVRDAVDDMNAATYLTLASQQWLACWLDLIAILVVLAAGLLVVLGREQVDPSISGVVLSSVLALRQMIQLIVQQLAQFENSMHSAERMHHYGTDVPEEKSHPTTIVADPGLWPGRGEINMVDVQMRYRPELPYVLRGLSIMIKGGEKIGIVGRTGAGKSSIAAALFRLVELSEGRITIDGLDISIIPLPMLRSRMSIIIQDPTLFRGTVRSNLDPFDQHTDMELWNALYQTGISDNTDAGPTRLHLDSPVDEDGANFSQGQRQLMAITRALVRNTQIIICDEATSSIDPKTDERVQETMLRAFAGKTILTIAHRLKTIVRYDRICVLEQGRIVELDEPLRLWERGGIFRGMCDHAGVERRDFDTAAFA